MAARWYVLRSKPHKEVVVWKQVQAHDLESYFPRLRDKSARGNVKPYFPGYLFVRADLDVIGESVLQWMPHSLGLVTFGGIPATVPNDIITALRQQVAAIKHSKGAVLPTVKSGDRVEIRSGPFAGYEAIFDMRLSSSDRVRVLLRMLNDRCVSMELNASQIQTAS